MITKNGFEQFLADCKDKKLVAFGASVFLQIITMNYKELNLENTISYIVDNNIEKDGTKYDLQGISIEVHSLQYLLKDDLSNIILLITAECFAYEIYNQLVEINSLQNVICYCLPMLIASNEDDEFSYSLSRDKVYIPKIIHCFWFSGSEKDDLTKKCLLSWKKFCPDYEIMEWNTQNYDVTKNTYMYEAYKHKKWAYATDYARLDVIYKYGGFYLDFDLELLRKLDELLSVDFVAGFGPLRDIELAAFGAKKKSPIVRRMLELYQDKKFDINNLSLSEVQPVLMDKFMKEYGFEINGKFQNINNQIILPRSSFSPRNWFTGEMMDTRNSFGIHHCAGNWITKTEKSNQRNHNMRLLSAIFN